MALSAVRRRTLRTRIALRFAAVLALAIGISLGVQRAVLLSQLDARVDADLAQEVTELRRLVGGRDADGRCLGGTQPDGGCAIGRDPRTGEPFGDDVEAVFDTFLRRNVPADLEVLVAFVDGRVHAAAGGREADVDAAATALLPLARTGVDRGGDVATAAGALRYRVVPAEVGPRDAAFGVASFVEVPRRRVGRTLLVSTATSLGLLGVATAAVHVLTGRVLSPVRAVRETARRISDTDLSRRIQVQGDDEIARLAMAFNDMLDRLEGSFSAQRAFLDDVSHELRGPITIVQGHLELLGDDPDEREEVVAIAVDELDRMHRMVEELLLIARAEQPDFLDVGEVDLGALTRELHAKAAAMAPRRWEVDAVAEGVVVGDRHRLTQAVVQLAHNAVRHTGPDDVVAVGSALVDGCARLWVRDSGPGIDPAAAGALFDRYVRGTGARDADSTGLGLSIVRAIAEAHGGSVDVDTVDGGGAVVGLRIPIAGPGVPR